MNIKKLKYKLEDEMKRLKDRKASCRVKSNAILELTSLDGSLLTVRKVLGWLDEK